MMSVVGLVLWQSRRRTRYQERLRQYLASLPEGVEREQLVSGILKDRAELERMLKLHVAQRADRQYATADGKYIGRPVPLALKRSGLAWLCIGILVLARVVRRLFPPPNEITLAFWVIVAGLGAFCTAWCFAYAFAAHKFGIKRARKTFTFLLIAIVIGGAVYLGHLLSHWGTY